MMNRIDTVERVVNGTYTMQRQWIEQHGLEWNAVKAQGSAQEMFVRIFEMKFLPPGRGMLKRRGEEEGEERREGKEEGEGGRDKLVFSFVLFYY